MKSTYMCFLKDFKENRPRLALILRLTAIVGIDMIYNSMILRLTAIVGIDMIYNSMILRLTAIVGIDMIYNSIIAVINHVNPNYGR